jgi:hypothetical protein
MKAGVASQFVRNTSWILLAAALTVASTARAQTPPDSSGVAKPDSAAVAKPDTVATPAPPAPAPATTAPAPATAPLPAAAAPAAVTATAAPASAAPAQEAGMFSKGNRRVNGVVGWGHSFDNDYLLIGLGVGYYIRNGLDVGVDFEGWFLADPTLYKLSPRVDYVMWQMKRIKPYAGAFYRWNFIGSGIDDKSSLGGRFGAFYQSRGGRSMAGAGMVYERYLNLDDRIGSSDVFYPEVFVSVSF